MVMDAQPSPQCVGREFVRQYYTLLHRAPTLLHRFYTNQSSFIHGGLDVQNHEPTLVIGQKNIYNKIQELNFRDCHAKISQVDAQATLGNGVVVQVTGELSNGGQPMRRFTQTFVLAAQSPKNYYVHNDIFRYQDYYFEDENDVESRSENDDEQDNSESSVSKLPETPVTGTPIPTPAAANVAVQSATVVASQQNLQQQQQPVHQQQMYYSMQIQQQQNVVPVAGVSLTPVVSGNLQQPQPQRQASAPSMPGQFNQPQQVNGLGHDEQVLQQQHLQQTPSIVPQSQPTAVISPVVASSNVSVGISSQQPININQQAPPLQQQFETEKIETSPSPPISDPIKDEPLVEKIESKILPQEPKTFAHLLKANPSQQSAPPSVSSSQQHPQQRGESHQSQSLPQRNNMLRNNKDKNDQFSERRNFNSNSHYSNADRDNQLFIGTVPPYAVEDEVRQIFSKFGTVIDLKFFSKAKVLGQNNNRSPNYGFITYDSREAVAKCLQHCPLFYSDGSEMNVEEKKTSRMSGRQPNPMSNNGPGLGSNPRQGGQNRPLSNTGGPMMRTGNTGGNNTMRGGNRGPTSGGGGFNKNAPGGGGGNQNRNNSAGNNTGGGNAYGRR